MSSERASESCTPCVMLMVRARELLSSEVAQSGEPAPLFYDLTRRSPLVSSCDRMYTCARLTRVAS